MWRPALLFDIVNEMFEVITMSERCLPDSQPNVLKRKLHHTLTVLWFHHLVLLLPLSQNQFQMWNLCSHEISLLVFAAFLDVTYCVLKICIQIFIAVHMHVHIQDATLASWHVHIQDAILASWQSIKFYKIAGISAGHPFVFTCLQYS